MERNSAPPPLPAPPLAASQNIYCIEYPDTSRTRQVVEPQDAISLGKRPSKLPGRLSVGQLITPQSDVYEKDAKLCGDSPPGLRFAIR